MFWDDLRKLIVGPTLYRLDTVLAARLVPVFYALGLAATGLWAIDHLVQSFAFNFGQGLWGILEILVYVPLSIVALRVISELVLVYLKAHAAAVSEVELSRKRGSLADEVSAAIHELADDTDATPAPPTAS